MYTLIGAVVGTAILLLYIGYMLQQEYEKGYSKGYSEGLVCGIEKGRNLENSEM